MKTISYRRTATALLLMGALAGCGRGITSSSDGAPNLEQWTKQAESKPAPDLEPMPAITQFDPIPYGAGQERDPFKPAVIDDASQALRPNADRPKQALERFVLDTLVMVGTIGNGAGRQGLLRAPDGIVYRVRPGQYLGQNDGQVSSVEEGRIVLSEVVRDGNGGWEAREAAVVLAE